MESRRVFLVPHLFKFIYRSGSNSTSHPFSLKATLLGSLTWEPKKNNLGKQHGRVLKWCLKLLTEITRTMIYPQVTLNRKKSMLPKAEKKNIWKGVIPSDYPLQKKKDVRKFATKTFQRWEHSQLKNCSVGQRGCHPRCLGMSQISRGLQIIGFFVALLWAQSQKFITSLQPSSFPWCNACFGRCISATIFLVAP